ncbi:outer membrane beta-barrel protein [Aquimarina pacifica]|uniref:outer membrane beta-barrel protein n=1 Tax=Aquimarina pacifica TaxID=1296415 RepID=UPI001F4D1B9C|nr:hypothetical protein [Aquimarina pacifica]
MKKKCLLSIFTALMFISTQAQSGTDEYIDVSIGLGISTPFDDVDIYGAGFYIQGEYVFGISNWVDLRPYAGLMLAKTVVKDNQETLLEYKADANAFLFGGKARIIAPIPWVAPYMEIGIGGSIGTFETFTPFTDIKKNGLLLHIPFSIGVALGRDHNFNLELTYYIHPSVRQLSGATAIGLSIPLRTNK